jgi:hypothetical protein
MLCPYGEEGGNAFQPMFRISELRFMVPDENLARELAWVYCAAASHGLAYGLKRDFILLYYQQSPRSIYLILPAALGLGVYSAFNRNVYQKH